MINVTRPFLAFRGTTRARVGFRLSLLMCGTLVGVISGCSSFCGTPRCKIAEFVKVVRGFDREPDRDEAFRKLKDSLNLSRDCSDSSSSCADNGADAKVPLSVIVRAPLWDPANRRKFTATLLFAGKADLEKELKSVVGESGGTDAEEYDAYIVNGGVIARRSGPPDYLVYRSPALTGDPLDYVETKAGARTPLDSRAIAYIREKAIQGNPVDYEEPNPFHVPPNAHAQSGWLAAPGSAANQYGLSFSYLGPFHERGTRMTGVILQFATRRPTAYDPQLLSQQLRATLSGMGFEDVESLMSAGLVNLTPTAEHGEYRATGNFVVARHYMPDNEKVFDWYSVAIFRRVALPPEMR